MGKALARPRPEGAPPVRSRTTSQSLSTGNERGDKAPDLPHAVKLQGGDRW